MTEQKVIERLKNKRLKVHFERKMLKKILEALQYSDDVADTYTIDEQDFIFEKIKKHEETLTIIDGDLETLERAKKC